MRKSRVLCLVSALVVLTMLLSSCGGTVALKKIINEEYDPSIPVFNTVTDIDDVEDYEYVSSTENLALFMKLDEGTTTYKLLNLSTSEVVKTLESDEDSILVAALLEGMPLLYTAEFEPEEEEPADPGEGVEPLEEESEGEKGDDTVADILSGIFGQAIPEETEFSLYDAAGTLVTSNDYCREMPRWFGDLIYYNETVYDVDKAGVLSNPVAVPEYMMITDDVEVTDNYIYVFEYAEAADKSCYVYDRAFNYVASYVTPAYAVGGEIEPLNDGKLMIQYSVVVDAESKKYDVLDGTMASFGLPLAPQKYNVVTQIFDPVKGKLKSVNFDYVLEEVITNQELYDAEDGARNLFNDKFDNLVVVFPIEDKQINYTDKAADCFVMSNKGKLGASVKYHEDQNLTEGLFLSKISDDTYMVGLLGGGYAFIDAKGKTIKVANNMEEFEKVGKYFVSENAIYNLDLTLVYRFAENDAELYDTISEAILVQVETEDGYEIVKYYNGENEVIYTYDEAAEDNDKFAVESMIDGYVIISAEGDKYEYYNVAGEVVLETETRADFLAYNSVDDTVLVAVEGEETVAYKVISCK